MIFCDECAAKGKKEVKATPGLVLAGMLAKPVKMKCGEVPMEFEVKLQPRSNVQLCKACFAEILKHIDFAKLLAESPERKPASGQLDKG